MFPLNFETVQEEIIAAIHAVRGRHVQQGSCIALDAKRKGDTLRIRIRSPEIPVSLKDKDFEGAAVEWDNPLFGNSKIKARVVALNSKECLVILRGAHGPAPKPNNKLVFYPLVYLEELAAIWSDSKRAKQYVHWTDMQTQHLQPLNIPVLSSAICAGLTEAQNKSMTLLGSNVGKLIGGDDSISKTIAVMVGHRLLERPESKILIIAWHNDAADNALIAVDKVLTRISSDIPAASLVRKECVRYGRKFRASEYLDRKHLLGAEESDVVEQLDIHQKKEPHRAEFESHALWKAEDQRIRGTLDIPDSQICSAARVISTTVMSAFYKPEFFFQEDEKVKCYDLLLFADAHAVSIAHSLPLCLLAKQVIFAGDPDKRPKYLKVKCAYNERWLGRSMFAHLKEYTFPTFHV